MGRMTFLMLNGDWGEVDGWGRRERLMGKARLTWI